MMDCEQESMEHQEDPQVLHTVMALLEFGVSKQQLKLKDPTFTGTVIDVEKALGAIGKDISILCPGKSPTGSKEVFVLQVWSDRWKSYVNMSQDDTVKDGDHLTVSQVSQPEDSSSAKRGSALCRQIGSKASSSVLRKMFATTSTVQKRPIPFDPTADCVFEQQKKKKKAARNKISKISIMVVRNIQDGVPKAANKDKLIEEGRMIKVDLTRQMQSGQVRAVFLNAVKGLNIKAYQVLDVVGQKLAVSKNQHPDGDTVIENASRRKGNMLYVMDSTLLGEPSISCGDHCTQSDDDLPKIDLGGKGSSCSGSAARQALILEQDRAFEESLRADREKVRKMLEVKENDEKKMQLKLVLRRIFEGLDENGIKITFRLPESSKIVYTFNPDAYPLVLYQCVYSLESIQRDFNLFQVMPRQLIDIDSSDKLSVLVKECNSIVVEYKECNDMEFIVKLTPEECGSDDIVDLPLREDIKDNLREARQQVDQFVCTLRTSSTGTRHVISRSNVFNDVMKLFTSEEIMKEFPLRIKYDTEIAYDTGGVLRDMLSAFWEVAYLKLFDGGSVLTPLLHAQVDMTTFPLLGKILSHGYFVAGYLPLRIAFPTLAGMLLGQSAEVSDDMLITAFANSISPVDASVIKDALKVKGTSFRPDTSAKLLNVMSRYESRVLPSPSNLKQQILQVSRFQFIVKPMPAVIMINSGIAREEVPFWKKMSTEQLYSLYRVLSASSLKILQLIQEPEDLTKDQERVLQYLKTYIGNLRVAELERFLRFVCGSSVCPDEINVTFNSVSGLARRPIGHTCSYTLELSTMYSSYLEFENELNQILAAAHHDDADWTWRMDAV